MRSSVRSSPARSRGRDTPPRVARRRLRTNERRAQILTNATRIIGKHGLTVLSVEEVARSCGVSKALIYVHFATQSDILCGVLHREYERLSAAGLDEALRLNRAEDALVTCGGIYMRRISKHGTVLHALLSDPLFVQQMAPRDRTSRDRVVRTLARKLHRELKFSIEQAVLVIVLLAAIPERAGRLVFEGQIDVALANELCADLIRSSLRALVAELVTRNRTSDKKD